MYMPACSRLAIEGMMAHCQEEVSWADTDMTAAEKLRVGTRRGEAYFMWSVAGRSHD